jgi:hypothetical protein
MTQARLKQFNVFLLRRPTGTLGNSLGICLLENNILRPNEYYIYVRQQRHHDGYGKRHFGKYAEKIETALEELHDLGIVLEEDAYISELTEAMLFKIKDEANLRLLQLLKETHMEGSSGSCPSKDKYYIISANKYIDAYGNNYEEIARFIDREPITRSKDTESLYDIQ